MVAKTPTPKERRMAPAHNPNLFGETMNRLDRCVGRLQELQYTVTGGAKVVSGVTLSPRSTRGYLRTSLRCKQESMRMRNAAAARKSPIGKFQGSTNGDWRRMSLPAMLLGETVVEILQASQFAKEIATAAAKIHTTKDFDPKTPITIRKITKPPFENTQMQARRKKEKQGTLKTIRSESSPAASRARSRIRFKSTSPLGRREEKSIHGRPSLTANRVSPRNKPWAKKTVLFPNPLFLASSSSSPGACGKERFYKTRSPIINRTKTQTPHKFIIKSPSKSLKSQFKSKKAVPSPAMRSPTEKIVLLKARRCSFSPSKLVNRMVSPLKTRNTIQRSGTGLISGLKQRPNFSTPERISTGRII